MTAHFKRGIGAAIFLVSTSPMALAQVTAQDVWSDWKSYMTSFGYEVTGAESASGDTLTIRDLSMSIDLPENDGSVSLNMNSLVFDGKGDGTVEVIMPGIIPLRISGQEDGEEFDVVVDITQSGQSMIVSGDPNDLSYDFSASQVGLTLASLMIEGQPNAAELARFTVTMTNVQSSSQVKIEDARRYTQSMSVGSLSYDAAFKDPESDGNVGFQGSIVGLSFKGDSVIPPNMDSEDFRAILDAGFALNGSVEYGSGNSNFNVVGDGQDFSLESSSQGGRLGVIIDGARIVYDVSQKGSAINVVTNQLPFPVELAMAELGFKIAVPVAQSDEPQDFGLLVRLVDFTTPDTIWGLLDPSAALPRDPVTVILDLSGQASLFADIVNPEVAANLNGPPGEVNAVTINQLLVSAAGAKLSGTGDFTFDNNDLASFNGIPAPTGEANLELVGANGLMDNLIKMGLLAEEAASVPRMMLGMLTVPGAGEDTLTSKIEFGEGGQITANGQRIK